jgi:hypothetical protein
MIFDGNAFSVIRAVCRLLRNPGPGISGYITFHSFTLVHSNSGTKKPLLWMAEVISQDDGG